MNPFRRQMLGLSALTALIAILGTGCAGGSRSARATATRIDQPTVVPVACGECLFGMKGKDCDLAVKLGGRPYFVDGVNGDDLGDWHAADGICSVVRQARVTGEVRGGRFIASHFELLPAKH